MQNSLSSGLSRMSLNQRLTSNGSRLSSCYCLQRFTPCVQTLSSSKSEFQQGTTLINISTPLTTLPIVVGRSSVVECEAKQKCKTRKAAAKRFKVTGGGKLMHRHPNKQHLNEKKRRRRIVRLTDDSKVLPTDWDNIKKCMPHAKI